MIDRPTRPLAQVAHPGRHQPRDERSMRLVEYATALVALAAAAALALR